MYSDLSFICVGSGIFVFLLGLLTPGQLLKAIPLSLDFWTAAGLLKLSGGPSSKTILTAALLILIRKLTNFSLKAKVKKHA